MEQVAELDAKVRPKLRPFTGLRDFLATVLEMVLVLANMVLVLANSTTDFLTPPAILLLLESARRIGRSGPVELGEEVEVVVACTDGRTVRTVRSVGRLAQ